MSDPNSRIVESGFASSSSSFNFNLSIYKFLRIKDVTIELIESF
jgi:hypothetical protein